MEALKKGTMNPSTGGWVYMKGMQEMWEEVVEIERSIHSFVHYLQQLAQGPQIVRLIKLI